MGDHVLNPVVEALYLLSAVLFIFGLKGLTRVRTARRGNAIAGLAMLIAIIATFVEMKTFDWQWIVLGLAVGSVAGAVSAYKVQMTSMPEMVGLFNGFGGVASSLVAISNLWFVVIEKGQEGVVAAALGDSAALTTVLSLLVGGVTFSGSMVAFAKLAEMMRGEPLLLPGRHVINGLLIVGSLGLGLYGAFVASDLGTIELCAWLVLALSLLLGIGLVIGIGGADMPVVISLLNSYSGIAAGMTGFVLNNNVLIISGALVGASGIILTKIMCVAMNRTLTNVLFGGFGAAPAAGAGGKSEYKNVRSYSAEEAAMVLEAAESVVFVPGYGLAVAQAQHVVRELADQLQKRGSKVTYGIHPVAGRMPGHMNVLLAEADVPYDQLLEMDQVNGDFKNTDVVIVVGANDVVNPAAKKTPGSPIWGMPILEVYNARTVIMIKRSLSPGFAGIKNELFEYDNTMMLFADAKKALQDILREYKELVAS